MGRLVGEEGGGEGRGEKRRKWGGTARSSHPMEDPELKALLSLCAASAALSVYRLG